MLGGAARQRINLWDAIERGENFSLIESLVNNGAGINARNYQGKTPLHIACSNGSFKVVKFLIAKGADINACNYEGKTPLHFACENEYDTVKVIKFLLKKGVYVNVHDDLRQTPLHIAARIGNVKSVKFLLGVDGIVIHKHGQHKRNALHYAAMSASIEVVKLLLEKGLKINDQDQAGHTPLHFACANGCLEVVQFLLNNGADANALNQFEETTLCYTLGYENREELTKMAASLIANDLKVSGSDRERLVIASTPAANKRRNISRNGRTTRSCNVPEGVRYNVFTASLMVDAGTDKPLSSLFSPYMEMSSMIPNRAPATFVARRILNLPSAAGHTTDIPNTAMVDAGTDKPLSSIFSPYMEMSSMIPNRAPATFVARRTLNLPSTAGHTTDIPNTADNPPNTLYADVMTAVDQRHPSVIAAGDQTDTPNTADNPSDIVVGDGGMRHRLVNNGGEAITASSTLASNLSHGARIKGRRCCDFVRRWFR